MAHLAECICLLAALSARRDVLVHCGCFGVRQFVILPGD
jgi:hypothetical protein